jgi:hypothetical protein
MTNDPKTSEAEPNGASREHEKPTVPQVRKTMPMELRAFAKPEPPQRLVAPENEAEFKAAIDALRLLNGGPAADPFYVDPPRPPAGPDLAAASAPASVKAYVPPTPIDAAEPPASGPPAKKVLIREEGAEPPPALRDPDDASALVDATEPEEKKKHATPASPWRNPTADVISRSALPSALGPRDPAEHGAPASSAAPNAKSAGAPGRRTSAAALIGVLGVAVAFGAWALLKGGTRATGAQHSSSTAAAAAPASPPSVVPTPAPSDDDPPVAATVNPPVAATVNPPAATSATPTAPRTPGKRPPGDEPRATAAPATAPPTAVPRTQSGPAPTAVGGTRVFGN